MNDNKVSYEEILQLIPTILEMAPSQSDRDNAEGNYIEIIIVKDSTKFNWKWEI